MNLQEAVQLVQAKFAAESQDQTEGPAIDAYHDAFEKCPVLMEVATYCFADQIVQQNYEMRKKMMEQGAAGAEAPPQGTA